MTMVPSPKRIVSLLLSVWSCWFLKGVFGANFKGIGGALRGGGQKQTNSATNVARTLLSGDRPNFVIWSTDDQDFTFDERPFSGSTKDPDQYPEMPHYMALREESGIFTRAYTPSPKCAPSRYNLMTMKYCSRSITATDKTSKDFDIHSDDFDGRVSVDDFCKIDIKEANETLATILSNSGYDTIQSGKWHLTDDAYFDDYDYLVESIKARGFTKVGGAYAKNINSYYTETFGFSHNMEWVLATAMDAINESIDEGKPFFLYMAPTLPNGGDVYEKALFEFNSSVTPAGILSSPPEAGMPSRESVWERALNASKTSKYEAGGSEIAGMIWLDDALGAMISYLEGKGILNNTFFVTTHDHGTGAKSELYEGGIRVFQFIRYPLLFSGKEIVSNIITANFDLGATILDIAGIDATYEHDAQSFLEALSDPSQGRKYIVGESGNDRGVITNSSVKYISRSWLDTNERYKETTRFPYISDPEQMYNVKSEADEGEQVNLVYCPNDPTTSEYLNYTRAVVCEHDQQFSIGTKTTVCQAAQWAKAQYSNYSCSYTNSPTASPTVSVTPAPTLTPAPTTACLPVQSPCNENSQCCTGKCNKHGLCKSLS